MVFLNINHFGNLSTEKSNIHLSSFLLTVSILAMANIILSLFLELQELRVVRILTTVIFFGWFLKFKLSKKKLFSLVFLLLVLSDIGIFFYENKWFCFLRFVSFIAINLILSFHIFNRAYIKKLKPFAIVIILVLFISCSLLVISLEDLLDFSIFGMVHEFLFYLYTLSTFLLMLFSVLFSLNDYSKKSDIFFGAVIAFLVSDILLMVGYYQDIYLVIQIERVVQILAIALLLYYILLLDQEVASEWDYSNETLD